MRKNLRIGGPGNGMSTIMKTYRAAEDPVVTYVTLYVDDPGMLKEVKMKYAELMIRQTGNIII